MHNENSFRGEKLRLGRLFTSWSLDDLGEKVAASRQYIHQLETGAKQPTEAMVAALAAALCVQRNFFFLPLTNPITENDCHFRKLFTAARTVIIQATARGTLVELFVSELEKKVRMPKVNFPDFGRPESLEKIEEIAERARKYWNLGLEGPITNMTRVLENSGAIVVHFEDISDRIDALSISRKRPIVVRSSAKTAAVRLRFDLAHECGHLVMHQGIATGDHETEDQANRFASAFLLPRVAFAKEFPRTKLLNWRGMFEMKRRWKVSVRAIVRRAFDLGLIDAAKYRTANIYLSKTGQLKGERDDDRFESERSELLDAALAHAEKHHSVEMHGIIDSLGFTSELVSKMTGHTILPLANNIVRLRQV